MQIYQRMYELLGQRAREIKIRSLSIGLGYTAVVLEDESIGIAYTWIDEKTSCSLFDDPNDYEGTTAVGLLEKLFAEDLLSRSVAIATVNALNHGNCASFQTDGGTLLEDLGVVEGRQVSMVGYFAPIVDQLEALGAVLNVYDLGKGVGAFDDFAARLKHGTEAFILSSTSIIHGSTEDLLAQVERETPCALLGPTTPMLPEVFSDMPVTILAGTCPQDVDRVLTAVRHARGTHAIQKSSRKVYWKRP